MSQHDMNVANQGFPNFRTDLNNALVALVSNSSGATEPTTKFSYQWWLDTSTTPTTLKIRNTANDTWITAMYLNQSTNLMTLAVGAGATGTPSYSTIGDLNTGIWFPAADTVALSTNGTERWRADSSGTFTVGGISTANRKFEVNLNGQTTISYGDNSLTTHLTLDNLSTSATTNHGSGIYWRVCTDSSAIAINSGRIAVIKEQLWTSTASTQDSAMTFSTTLDGSLAERMRISSAGEVSITGVLTVPAGAVGAPSIISTTGTSDTGQWFPAADTIAWSTAGSERMRINSLGNLILGGTTQAAANSRMSLYFAGGGTQYGMEFKPAADDTYAILFLNASSGTVGSITNTSTTTAYNTSSDYRLKENVTPMQNALTIVAKLNPVNWKWKSNGSAGQGFIAHELQEIIPECVTGKKDAVDVHGKPIYQGVDTSFLVATLTAAIQELKAELDTVKAKLDTK